MAGQSALRMTRQRQVILEELRECRSHPTADELYARVRRRLPRISLGTVYRNLEQMAERGLARKLGIGGTQKRFDGDTDEHHHVRCIGCGRVTDVQVGKVAASLGRVSRAGGYRVIGYRLELLGYCRRCRRKERM